MIPYLSKMPVGMKILCCYLFWYLYFAYQYFDADLGLWVRSFGIAILVGFAHNINAFATTGHSVNCEDKKELLCFLSMNIWKILRFMIIPFCVSSFSCLIKDKNFILIFSPNIDENAKAFFLCVLFWITTWLCGRLAPRETY